MTGSFPNPWCASSLTKAEYRARVLFVKNNLSIFDYKYTIIKIGEMWTKVARTECRTAQV